MNQDAIKYYRELFEFEKEMVRADRGRLFSPTVTTNYDLVFEQCAKRKFRHTCKDWLSNTDGERMLPLEILLSKIGIRKYNT